MDITKIGEALIQAGIKVSGVSQPAEPHNTDTPATFIKVGDGLLRLDWDVGAAPTKEQEQAAVDVLKSLGIGDIGYVLSSVSKR